jgi:hypothetical protein
MVANTARTVLHEGGTTMTAEIVQGRECESCMMCCKAPTIRDPELEKPPGAWCRHAVPGKGCGIYDHRPGLCRRFYCHWMLNPALGPEWKPDRAKFVLYGDALSTNRIDIVVDPAFPNAWTKEPYFTAIKKWISDGIERDLIVLVKRTMGENGLDYKIYIGDQAY